jgi:hypothetical protein
MGNGQTAWISCLVIALCGICIEALASRLYVALAFPSSHQLVNRVELARFLQSAVFVCLVVQREGAIWLM